MIDEAARARLNALFKEMRTLGQFLDCEHLDEHTKGSNGDTPLIVALIRRDRTAMTDLLSAGADPNAIGEDDESALHWAARAGADFVRALLAHGAVAEGTNIDGRTAIDIARRRNDEEMLSLFHDKHA